MMDERYDFALTTALVILDEIVEKPDRPRHERLAIAIYSILHGLELYEEADAARKARARALVSEN